MVIRLTKNHKKPSGKIIPKGTIIEVAGEHPYKEFEVVMDDGNLDTPKNQLKAEEIKTDKNKA